MGHGIMSSLLHGTTNPAGAKSLALDLFLHEANQCEYKWLLYHAELQIVADELLKPARRVVAEQEYKPCLKAGFFTALFSPHMHNLVTRIEGTRPPHNASNCRIGDTCLRQASGIGGDRYDNCLSVHAAQWLDVPQGFDPASLLWMEAGAVLVNGRYELASNQGPYRCSMCIKTMAGKGIVDVCQVGEIDGKAMLHFAPIETALSTLVICNTADMLAAQK